MNNSIRLEKDISKLEKRIKRLRMCIFIKFNVDMNTRILEDEIKKLDKLKEVKAWVEQPDVNKKLY